MLQRSLCYSVYFVTQCTLLLKPVYSVVRVSSCGVLRGGLELVEAREGGLDAAAELEHGGPRAEPLVREVAHQHHHALHLVDPVLEPRVRVELLNAAGVAPRLPQDLRSGGEGRRRRCSRKV